MVVSAVDVGDVILGGVAIKSKGLGGEVRGRRRKLVRLLLVLSVVVYALGFLHLRADFPNGSPWPDTAKMASEGWYAGAAIHHFVQGRWDLPGLLHPAVAMPVWPVMLGVWFDVTSVSMLWARVLTMLLYGVSLVLLYRLMWRARPGRVAAVVVLLTVIDPFCYAFDRLAILEPVTVMWFLLALWIAGGTRLGEWWKEALLGVVIALLVLTKAAGVVLVPAVIYMLWASGRQGIGRDGKTAMRSVSLGALVGGAVWRGWWWWWAAGVLWAGYVRLVVMRHHAGGLGADGEHACAAGAAGCVPRSGVGGAAGWGMD